MLSLHSMEAEHGSTPGFLGRPMAQPACTALGGGTSASLQREMVAKK